MGYRNVYIGHVETINPDAKDNTNCIEHKVVALELIGFDNKKKIPNYKPLRKYSEYYKLISVEPILGKRISDKKINKALKNTGKSEVKVLKKVA